MRNLFNSIQLTKPNKNVFDLSHDVKLSLNMGNLVPTMCMECVPGDKFNISCESLLRFSPLVAPVMHRMDVYMHYFFVPNRILWKNWEYWITNSNNPDTGTYPDFPRVQVGFGVEPWNPLMDYLGIPDPGVSTSPEFISALPFAAYQKVWNEYYRDQNLIADISTLIQLGDGDNTFLSDLFPLRKRAWEHDYFTAALPFAQKGAAVTLPIGAFSDVKIIQQDAAAVGVGDTLASVNTTDTPSGSPDTAFMELVNRPGTGKVEDQMYADTSSLTAQAASINDLRRAFRLQEWLEKAARGGSRYIENIFSHFGVKSSDKRLNRPEYITGTKSPVIISEVLNTTGTANAPQGEMAGHGISVTSGKYGSYYCEEHGYIIGIMSVMPKTAYQQGIDKHWLKGNNNDPFEFFWPSFAHIGEQAIERRELYAFTNAGDTVFGYVPRYAEYKFMSNRVAGDFRNTLNFWHLGRIFGTTPALNQAFVEADPTTRVFAVTDPLEDKLYAHILHKIRAVRTMPKFGTPQF